MPITGTPDGRGRHWPSGETATWPIRWWSSRGLHEAYGSVPVLRGVDLRVAAQEVLVVVGPSGSGKSTLLRCINFLEDYDAGRVLVNGHLVGKREVDGRLVRDSEASINRERAEIGMVFQGFYLFTHRTVLQNVILAPMRVRGLSRAEAEAVAVGLLRRIGLLDKANAYPEQWRVVSSSAVAIVRALAMKPRSCCSTR
jgi:polar amino acid transport system ATP-binding protein